MTDMTKPATRPARPYFSSGPCAKRPGWSVEALTDALLGRSHRSKPGKSRLQHAIDLTRDVLQVPDTHRIGIVPGSDTGAVEMAMWTMLGERGVDVLAWESFGSGWVTDVLKQLKVEDARKIEAGYGELPDLGQVDFDRDVIFTWNGTTSGVRVPNGDFIPDDRGGLTICDATSAAFAQDLPFDKLDVVTFSWQKVLGGEAAHGVIILGPRAVERLENYTPDRALPKIFRLTKGGKLIEGVFKGETINTPSMLCVEDYIDALEWAKSAGGLDGLMKRADANAKVIFDFVDENGWIGNLAKDPATRSNTSVCLTITDPDVLALDADAQAAFAKGIVNQLDTEGVAYDIGAYRDAPAGLRIWAGATVETSDMEALMPWLTYAFETQKMSLR
ncbi:phosphoserine transaminase [Notoacmeibacter ruber]|uniref:phosphoserine transaminase n=1 Tax=Notoacmeibacter ruber TaxID=2670375 RepID=A0A3L7JJK9_9HYPH|nr:phosphoserine transaminase [Notoacmeibacter ruber]RLQ88672.1 phosphoserine transaminase [Notoacmeibacter ruber]